MKMTEFEITRQEAAEILKDNMDVIRINMRRLMKDQKLTQEKLGDMIGSDRFFINYLLKRKGASPKIITICKVAKALGVTFSDLIK